MRTMIVLAMHGSPPRDFPPQEAAEFFRLHARLGHAGPEGEALEHRYAQLDAKMRTWPRSADNDPFYAGSQELADHLRRTSGSDVVVGFNEFCAPSLDEALDQAAAQRPDRVIVVTPMMTRGGEHSEVEIPEAVQHARERYPGLSFIYVWPLDVAAIARFLAGQMQQVASRI